MIKNLLWVSVLTISFYLIGGWPAITNLLLVLFIGFIIFVILVLIMSNTTPAYLKHEKEQEDLRQETEKQLKKQIITTLETVNKSIGREEENQSSDHIQKLLDDIFRQNQWGFHLEKEFASLMELIVGELGLNDKEWGKATIQQVFEGSIPWKYDLLRELVRSNQEAHWVQEVIIDLAKLDRKSFPLDIIVTAFKKRSSDDVELLAFLIRRRELSSDEIMLVYNYIKDNKKGVSRFLRGLKGKTDFKKNIAVALMQYDNFGKELTLRILQGQLNKTRERLLNKTAENPPKRIRKGMLSVDDMLDYWWLHQWRFCDHPDIVELIKHWFLSLPMSASTLDRVIAIFDIPQSDIEQQEIKLVESDVLHNIPSDDNYHASERITDSQTELLRINYKDKKRKGCSIKISAEVTGVGHESGIIRSIDDVDGEEVEENVTAEYVVKRFPVSINFTVPADTDELIETLEEEDVMMLFGKDNDWEPILCGSSEWFYFLDNIYTDFGGQRYRLKEASYKDEFVSDSDSYYCIPVDDDGEPQIKSNEPIRIVRYETGTIGANIGGEPISDSPYFDDFHIDPDGIGVNIDLCPGSDTAGRLQWDNREMLALLLIEFREEFPIKKTSSSKVSKPK